MTPQETYAIKFFMSQYPSDIEDFFELLGVISEADTLNWEDVEDDGKMPIAWEPFGRYSSPQVAMWIQDMAEQLTELFDPKDEPIQL